MQIILRDYQKDLYDKTLEALRNNKSVLLSAACGFGKSILIAHLANNLPGRTLILSHRMELINQNSEFIGGVAYLLASKKTSTKNSKVVISMAQTIIRRLEKYGSNYIGEFDTIIIDEAHLDFFKKIYDLLPHKNRIGLTATPLLNKNEYKTIDYIEWMRRKTLASEYNVLMQGISERKLIEKGYLIEDFNIQLTPPNLNKLVNSNSNKDGYTSASLTEVFGNRASIETVVGAYQKYGIGKKVLIFSPTTKVNLNTYKAFVEIGANCKLFDSVNSTDMNRKEIVEWFNNESDAVLLNVGIFNVGFSVNELEVLIYNKKTKSLSLWLQSLGRGSRTSKKILKDKFLVVDLGLNITQHGRWSMERNWQQYFKPGIWKKKNSSDLLSVWACKECGYYNLEGTVFNQETGLIECAECGAEKKQIRQEKTIKGKLVALETPTVPTANRIIKYVKQIGGDGNMVFRLFHIKILEMFVFFVEPNDYYRRKDRYHKRIGELFRPVYFSVLNDKELTGKNRRLKTEIDRIIEKIDRIY